MLSYRQNPKWNRDFFTRLPRSAPQVGARFPRGSQQARARLGGKPAAGAGHLSTTSLPVGGTSSNTVITGHSGMRERAMFDGLDLLAPGDEFVLRTLGRPFAYRVETLRMVRPDEVDVASVREGQDLCTLITCRPIGQNTHRLVVTARRCAYDPALLHQKRMLPRKPAG